MEILAIKIVLKNEKLDVIRRFLTQPPVERDYSNPFPNALGKGDLQVGIGQNSGNIKMNQTSGDSNEE